uniref:Protein Gawky n=1 Tax=Bursaphelenchus xylophilus TaxID=6326 RepID=A0A1I7RTY7_BURXY
MLFTEEPSYFNKPNSDNSVWKPPQDMSNGSGPPNTSKLNTWAGKQRQKENSLGSGSFNGTDDEKGWSSGNARQTPQDQSKVPWSDPDSMGNSLENDFLQMNLGPGQMKMQPNGQWGREVNQSTPWEVENRGFPADGPGNRFMGGVSMDNGTGQWRSWEHNGGFEQKEFHPGFPMGGMPNHKMPNNFYNGGNFMMQQGFADNRMMRNGPPHMNQQQPGQPWGNKYGGGQRNAPGGGGGFQQFGGPPQGGPMNMMPPSMMERVMGPPPPPMAQQHHGRGPHHPHGAPPPPPMHPIPPMPAQNPGGSFSVGTFNTHGASMMNDDSFWHDPNGDLRKWQRDTGTAHWGDPAKQQGQQIRRWTQVEEEDSLVGSSSNNQASPDSLKKDQDENHLPETGWGELPPINGSTTTPTSANPAAPHSAAPTSLASGWMGTAPQGPGGIIPPAAAPGADCLGWADSPRNAMPPSNFIPGGQFPPNNFYGGPPGNDWSAPRPPANMSYGQQPHMFEQPSNNKDIAEKLRLAASKGLIDINMFTSSGGPLPPNTIKLLNNILDVFTEVEKLEDLEANMSKLKMGDRKISLELSQKRNTLDELRDKLNNSFGVPMQPPQRQGGLSLADELTNMSTLPMGSDVAQLW